MVTASHNPPQDNGYKVYLGDGSQIVPPADAEISAAIDAVGPLDTVRRADGWTRLGEDVVDAYLADVVALVDPDGPRDLKVVYTPLHGVGGETVARVMERAGFAAPHVATAQARARSVSSLMPGTLGHADQSSVACCAPPSAAPRLTTLATAST